MTITYPIGLPSNLFGQAVITEVNTVGRNISPFTGRRNKQIFPGQYWIATYSLIKMNREEAEDFGAVISSLGGSQGSCTIVDVMNTTPRGNAKLDPGNPSVSGGDQTGNTLNIKGCPTEVSQFLVRGDRIQVGPNDRPRLYKVLETIDTDIAGTATLTVWPYLREPVIDDDPIFIFNPKGWFELDENNFDYGIESPDLYTMRLAFVETEL